MNNLIELDNLKKENKKLEKDLYTATANVVCDFQSDFDEILRGE